MDMQAEKAPYDLKGATKTFSRIGFALIAFFAAAYAALFAIELVLLLVFKVEEYSATAAILLSSIVMYGIGFPVFRLVLGKTGSTPPPTGKVRFSTVCILIVITFLFTYFGNVVGLTASALLENALGFALSENTLDLVTQLPWYVAFFFVVVIGPLVEECIFRKWIIDRTRVYGEKLSILFSAVLFAFFHMSVQQFFYAFLIGLVLGYLYMRTGSFRAVWFVHAALNFLGSVVPLLLMQYCGYTELLDAMTAGQEEMLAHIAADPVGTMLIMLYGLLDMTLLILGCVFFWLYRKRIHFAEAEKTLPRDTEATVAFANIGVILCIAMCVLLPIALSLLP